jgi:hypothetical protein
MRFLIRISIIVVLLALATTVFAGEKLNKFGVTDVAKVNFAASIRVGDVLLPQGNYEVRHTMVGEDHVMVFKQLGGKNAEAKVKCHLVPTKEKADQTQTIYVLNAAKERVLQTLVFKGDMAEHQF